MRSRKSWEVAWRRERDAGAPGRYVDAEPVRARLARLEAAHVPRRALARGTGLSTTAIKEILEGRHVHVQRRTAQRVATLSLSSVYGEQARGHVPRIGAVRRIQALMAMGWTHDAMAAAGAPGTPRLLKASGHLVTVQRWREVRDVYDRLSMTPGPSPETRGWARSLGYTPPLAWDDDTIDDPSAEPHGSARAGRRDSKVVDSVAVRRVVGGGHPQPVELTARERIVATRMLAATGASDTQIANRLGLSSRTVLRVRGAEQIPTGRPQNRGRTQALEWAAAGAATRTAARASDAYNPTGPRARTNSRVRV